MKYGLYLPNFEPWGNARAVAQLAREAEASGWDGMFLWDDLAGFDVEMVDPWIAMAAAAMVTTHIQLGALITPLPRRRPWKFARETISLDHLCGGRLVVGVGTGGGEDEWAHFGEETDHRVRGDMLDEALEVVTGLWKGEPFAHKGKHYHVQGSHFRPASFQQPRIPIWVGGVWPHKRPFQRMAKWDGMFPLFFSAQSPQEAFAQFQQSVQYVCSVRNSDAAFEVIALGATPLGHQAESLQTLRAYKSAGATWWLESIAPLRMGKPGDELWSYEQLHQRVLEGPPRF